MKSFTRIAFLAAVIATALSITGSVLAQGGGPTKDESTIASTGTAKVYRAPDYVDVVTGIEVQEKTASAAQASASSTMAKIVGAVQALKLAGADLQTGSVDLSPRYEERKHSDDPGTIIAYKATTTLRVRTADVKSVSSIIDAALGAGANRVDSVQFGIKQAIEAREEAVRLATKAAKRKADVMAGALDLRLGRMIHATTTTNQSGYWGVNRYSNMSQMSNEASGGGGAEDGAAVVPGKIEVWAEASLTFGVEETAK
jgi:uncharacterized protein YggE